MMHRDNHAINEVEDYYRVTITVPFCEHLKNEIEERFGDAPATIVKGFSMIPAYMANNIEIWKRQFQSFVNIYIHDLPCQNTIEPDLYLWETFWRTYTGVFPETITETIRIVHPMKKTFPNMYTALRLLATIPLTSCECERAVSVLRRLKTSLRNKK